MKRLFFLVSVVVAMLLSLPASAATVKVAEIHGAISPASAAYFLRALDEAQRARADLLVLRLDTPGGLDSSMREMIQGILASPVPVAIWVAPSGARAASAGTYLLYSAHVAAMAPGMAVSSRGRALAWTCRTSPRASMKIISSGISVLRIQNATGCIWS